MIIAIEGPDGCGKSTVVGQLRSVFRSAQFLQFPVTPVEYIRSINVLEPLMFRLFESMYDPDTLYICDRFFSITSRVYARVRGEASPLEGLDAWVFSELYVIYLEQSVEVLADRRDLVSIESIEQLAEIRGAYMQIVNEQLTAGQSVVKTEGGINKMVHLTARIVEATVASVHERLRRQANS